MVMYMCIFNSGGRNEVSPRLSTLEHRIEAMSLQLYVQKLDHYYSWLKQDLSTLTLSLSKYLNPGKPNLDWIHSISLQPRISIVKNSPCIDVRKTNILKMLSGDNAFGPLLSTLKGNTYIIYSILKLCDISYVSFVQSSTHKGKLYILFGK